MNKTYRLDNDFEIIGLWNLPNQDISNGVTGKLIYMNGSLKLEVYGEFNKEDENNTITRDTLFPDEECIVGFSQDGYTIILQNNIQIKGRMPSPGIPSVEYMASNC